MCEGAPRGGKGSKALEVAARAEDAQAKAPASRRGFGFAVAQESAFCVILSACQLSYPALMLCDTMGVRSPWLRIDIHTRIFGQPPGFLRPAAGQRIGRRRRSTGSVSFPLLLGASSTKASVRWGGYSACYSLFRWWLAPSLPVATETIGIQRGRLAQPLTSRERLLRLLSFWLVSEVRQCE